MSAILKTIVTRPSLSDVFWFEHLIDLNNLLIPTMDDINNFITEKETGFVSLSYVEEITWAEIVTRQSELRPDLTKLLDYKDISVSLPTSTRGIFSSAPAIGPNGEPPWNPFSLTFSWLTEYTNYDTFIANYSIGATAASSGKNYITNVIGPDLLTYNNTLTEELYVDGTLTDFDAGYKYLTAP
jgi:hypothetical protein